uniref:Mitochondrial import inner membrane translocase subunit n=1 Tax=Acrobeloides nanus TaxID=290746 RepID=A0A914DY77_9BILA
MVKLFDFEELEELKQLSQAQRDQFINWQKQNAKQFSDSDENVRLVVNLQTVMAEVARRCIEQCTSSPGTALTRREKDCLQPCTQPYREKYELLLKLEKELATQNNS